MTQIILISNGNTCWDKATLVRGIQNAWSITLARTGSRCRVTICGTPWPPNPSMPTPPWVTIQDLA
jgi:hypothetical protein